jgi:hypothetical protein
MSKISVIRASAGSGKTNSLISFFLELLIKEPTDYFKHILAVTFTNKATEEMKTRIIDELNILSSGEPSRLLDDLMKVSGFKEEHIRSKASVILQNILHNYSWLSVETIDTFFQRIIKAFTRELGIPGNYNIEIETRPVLQYAVDSLIDSLNDNQALLNWMLDFSENRIQEGKPWDFKNDLENLGGEVFKEEFSSGSDAIYKVIGDKEKLNDFRVSLYKITTGFENQLADYAQSCVEVLSGNGLDDSDFYQKGRGVGAYFRKLQGKIIERPNSYVIKMLDGSEYWPSGDSSNKELVIKLAEDSLLPKLVELLDYFESNFKKYNTSKLILKNISNV